MSYESIRRKLEQPTTDNSQTTQSGFSASDNRAEIKGRVQGFLTARKTQTAQNLFDPEAVERGRTKYEADKANAFAPQKEESTWEKIGRWLSGGTADTSLPMGGTAQVIQSKIAMPEKALEIGRLSDTARDEFYAQYDVDPAAAKAWAEEQIEGVKQQEASDLKDWAKEHPMWGNIVSLLPLQASGADYLNAVTDVWAGTNYYDPKDVSNPTAFMNTARAGAKEGSWLGTNPVGQFIDDVAYSSLQSLWSNVVSGGQIGAGPFSSLPLAFYSASSTINELMNEGYDPAQAGIVATTHGLVAFATEAIGSDTIIARALKNTKMGQSTKVFLKQLGKEIFRSMLAEGTEEVAEGVADQIIDSIVDLFFEKDTNEISRKKAEYLAAGKSEEKASRMAVMSFSADLLKDFVAGGLSGGLMAGTTTAVGQGIETGTQTWNAYQYGKTGDKAELVENIKTIADTHGGTYGEGLEATGKKGFKGLWENLKIGMAMSEANRDIETDAIANRLIELGENEDTARAQAAVIYRMSREATVSSADEKLVDTDIAKQVAREYSGSLETPSAAQHWVRDAWATQKAVSSTEPSPASEITREAVRESIAAEKEAQKKAVADEIETKFRKEQLIPYADKYGLDIEDILAQNTDLTTGAYRRAIQDSFNLASAGYSLEQVKSTIQLPMTGVLLQSYNNGLSAYAKSKGAAPTRRVNIRANAKIELASESDVARNAPNAPYKAIDLNELKTKKPKVYAGMLFLSKFVAPRIKRKIVFFDGGANTGGWRTADSIGINIGGSFELYRKTGNVVGLFMHEFGHDLRADSQELYDELRQIVINDIYKGDAAAFDAEVQAEMSSRAMVKSQYGEGENVDYINAEEEIIGNALAKVAESPESLERVFANNQGKQSIQRLFDMLKKLIGDIKEFFASFGHANSISDIIDENALAKIEDVLARYVEQIDNTPLSNIAESLPSDTTGVTDVSEAAKYSMVSFAEGCGFKVDPETRTWQLTPPATKVTENDIRNSPIGALISYSFEMKDISKAEADEQIAMFTRIANMCIGTNDFSMTMQFVGSSIFTGLKSNADKQYGTTYDFPSICTKTQAVIDAMSREMVRKKAGLTKDEIAIIYDKVWYDGNPVPCPECYVFSRWVGIGGLLDNIWHFQEMYSKMNPEQVRVEYKKYDAIFDEQFAELEARRKEGEKKVTKGQLKNKAKSQLEKEYSALIEKQQKAQDGGAAFTEADAARLEEITPIYDTIRSMTYIQKVYFADDAMTTVNKNFVVPAEILFDLNRGEDFAKKYPAAWSYRTTQGAGYGKAITPYAEGTIGEGIIGTVSMAKQAKAKAAHAMTASDNVTDRKSNPFIESRGTLNASARRTLESARRKQLNQAYIGGQRFQSTSDARFENFLDYLITALEVQAMGGMVQMYTKVSGAVEATNAWGFSDNQSLMPKGGGIKNGVIQDTAHGGMVPSVAFENRKKYKYAGTITIGVNDEHIRAMFADVNRDFIIPYHASGGDRLLIAAFRSILDSDEEAVQSSDYTRVQGEKILADDLLDNVEDVHKFREQRLAILTRKGTLDMDYINAPGNELLRRVYDSVNSGRYDGAKLTKGVCEGQIFPNEYWDTSLSYEESGKIVEDYLEYCRRLGFLHKFSGLIQTYDQKTGAHALVPLSGRDPSGNEVQLTDLAYKNGNPEDGIEPYYWKVLVDRRMYDNEGRYLPQQTIRLTSDTDRYATTFARNNKGSAREYSAETSAKTMEWIDEGGVRDTVMSLKDRGIELKSFSLKSAAPGVKHSERRVTGFYSQMGRVIEQAKANSFDARSLINMLLGKGVKAEEIKWSGITTFLDGKKSVSKSDLLKFIQDSMIEITEEERSGRSARFGLYTVEGDFSNNYREYLFKWSDLGYSNDSMDRHWGEPNVLAHARVDDTKDSQGSDVLFIEEIQSDWHNAAASAKGYMSADDFQKKQKIRQPITYFEDWVGEAYDAYGSKTENPGPRIDEFNVKMKDLGAPWRIMFDHGRYNVREGNKTVLAGSTWGEFLDELVDLDFTDYEEVSDQLYGTMPPEAPFKNNKYTDFVMKNMLRKAAAAGYEKIAWTTGKTQAERWSDDYSKAYEIEYDQDIPKFLEKFGKQWGAKPSLERLSNGVVAWTFPITDAMRESVVYEGQSLYSMRRIEDHTTIKSGSLFSGAGLLEQGLMYQLLIHDFGVEYKNSIAATWQENNGDGHIYAGETEGNVFNFDGKKYKGKMFHIHASPVCHNLSPAKHGYGEQPSDIASARKTLQIFLDAEAPVYTVENAKLYAKTESARIIKEGLENAGYIVDIGVYNSADYGSAQSRERTIIRAVRGDLVMPDRPRKLPRTRTWDQVTRNLWDGLTPITVNDIADSYLKAVKKTGIDITNVKVPTLLLQTTSGGTVTFAREGTQCPTLTTKCDDAVLCLPGGVILKPSTVFLGRLMGLPDDFKYPHYKNNPERIKTSVAATIIGNGIPVELTKAVVGGVIESAYQQIEGHALYSMRRVNNDLSPREYLTQATIETIKSPKERAEFERLATEYRTLDDKSLLLQSQIADLDFRIEQTRWEIKALDDALLATDAQNSEKVTNLIKRYGSASEAMKELRAQLRQSQEDLRALRKEEAEVEDRMSDILTVPLVERILDKQRKLTLEYERLLESTKAADQQKLANLRITMGEKVQEEIDRRIEMRKNLTAKFREREGVSYYLPRLQSALKDLATNVTKAPEPFRGPVYKILSLFDFKTRDKNGNLKKGQANIDRQEAQDRIKALLGTGSGSIQEWFAKYNIEISDDVKSWIEDTRSYLEWIILNQEELRVRSASAKELQSAYHFVRMLNTQLKNFTKAYTKINLDMSKLGKMAADYADSLGTRKSSEVGGIEKLMRYEHAQPITVFDRLGDAGREVFKLLAAGEGKRARNEQEIADFISTWDQADVKRWINPKETVDVKFQVLDKDGEPVIDEDGEEVFTTVKMTPAQMMTIYCTARDAAGLRHLLIGGFKLADVVQTRKGRRYHINDTVRKMTGTDLSNLIASMNEYDKNLIPFANSLQNFIDTVGTMWGNQVSIRRFGYEQFDIENYFPIITTLRNRTSDISKRAKLGELVSQIFALLNRSFTKDRLANASNPLIIQNVFDVFFEHMEDMAIYNAYALPVLDTMRFLQYTQYDEKGKEVWNLDEKLNSTYGNGVMQNYIVRLLVSINGERPMTNAENLALTALRLRNRVAVAANIRVVAQQPLSIARALEVIPAKYITPFGDVKATYHEMIEHSDIALKKSQGYFGADVKRSLMEKVLGSGSEWYNKYYDAVNKATELAMKPAEFGDMITWTTLWNACRNWVRDTNPGLSEDEFFKAVDEKFTDIIYRTQVVDSVLQKSEFMRQKDFWHRSTSSFKGEPTTSYNTLLRLTDRIIEARQRGEKLGQVWSSVKKPLLKAFVSYALNTLLIALATSVADAFRDDDDYETWWEKFQDALYGRRQGFFKSNLFESLNPFDLPVFSEAFALLQGYKADRVDLMFIQETIDIANAINRFTEKANWKDAMKLLGGVSMLSGLPLQNVAREVITSWNTIVNFIDPALKIETSPAPKSLGYEQFYNALTSENYVRATELIDEIMSNAKDEKEAYQGITSQVHDAFQNGKLTEDEAFDYLNICESYVPGIDRTDKQQRQRIEDWKEAMTEKGLKWKE